MSRMLLFSFPPFSVFLFLPSPLPASLLLYLIPFLLFVLPHVFVSLSCVATLCFSPIVCFYVALMITGLNFAFDFYFTLGLYFVFVRYFVFRHLALLGFLFILSFSY